VASEQRSEVSVGTPMWPSGGTQFQAEVINEVIYAKVLRLILA
jgi:hypothetical protein